MTRWCAIPTSALEVQNVALNQGMPFANRLSRDLKRKIWSVYNLRRILKGRKMSVRKIESFEIKYNEEDYFVQTRRIKVRLGKKQKAELDQVKKKMEDRILISE